MPTDTALYTAFPDLLGQTLGVLHSGARVLATMAAHLDPTPDTTPAEATQRHYRAILTALTEALATETPLDLRFLPPLPLPPADC